MEHLKSGLTRAWGYPRRTLFTFAGELALVMINCSERSRVPMIVLFRGALVAGPLLGSPFGAGDFSTSSFRTDAGGQLVVA